MEFRRLSEEAKNPKRDILLATVLVCLITGLLAACEVYAAQLIWPVSRPFPDIPTAFVHVAGYGRRRLAPATGEWNTAGGDDRLWNGIPARCGPAFVCHGPKQRDSKIVFWRARSGPQTPRNNVLFAGALALAGALTISFERGVELLNFGALIAFMGVNAAPGALLRSSSAQEIGRPAGAVCGFFVCLLLVVEPEHKRENRRHNLDGAGLTYGALRTEWFRRELINFEIPVRFDA